MASIIRVKRRIDEDPAEVLRLSCKKRRGHEENADLESVLSFAGTLHSKNESVSQHIKAAIRRKKIQNELHGRTADFKHSYHDSQRHLTTWRDEKAEASRQSRYRVTWAKRAIDLAQLDEQDPENQNTNAVDDSKTSTTQESDDKENLLKTVENEISPPQKSQTVKICEKSCPVKLCSDEAPSVPSANNLNYLESSSEEKKLFCIFDVENERATDEPPTGVGGISQHSASGIAVNNVPMTCRRASPEPTDDSQFVYDLYYTHNNLNEIDMAAVLTVEALCDELVHDETDRQGRDFVYDDSDDSNDEGNWRNDYPDEDPRFFENAEDEVEEYYAEDMVETNFLNEDGDGLLAYWMDAQCNIDGASDDDEDEYEDERSEKSDDD